MFRKNDHSWLRDHSQTTSPRQPPLVDEGGGGGVSEQESTESALIARENQSTDREIRGSIAFGQRRPEAEGARAANGDLRLREDEKSFHHIS